MSESPGRQRIIDGSYDRLNLGLGEYFSKFPPPHRIFLQTAQWDNAHLIRTQGYTELNRRGSELWNTSISIFEKALNDRVDQVFQLVSNYTTECGSIQIGLRTAVFSPHFEPAGNPSKWYVGEAREHQLLFEMNDVIRHIAKLRNLILYDGDTDFWTTYKYKYKNQGIYFRDYIHPKEIFTAIFGEKMMSLQYSKYLVGIKNKTCLEFPQLWLHSENFSQPRPKFITKVYIIHTYSRDHGNQSILEPLNYEQEQYPLINPGTYDSALAPIPHHRHKITPENTFYIIYDSVTNLMQSRHCNATDFNFQQNLRLGFGDILSVTQEELSDIKQGSSVPWITYHSNLLIRYSQQKEIFWITINGTMGIKRSINSMQVAMNHGFNLSQVIVVNDLEDMDIIPTGEPLMI
mmetsp:Transcript_8586/g.8517  ORF Transcript_8586/g.8517 Transcript_8586/m.8517 type:complete len:404 (-) Transcript_8586:16-1227(-)